MEESSGKLRNALIAVDHRLTGSQTHENLNIMLDEIFATLGQKEDPNVIPLVTRLNTLADILFEELTTSSEYPEWKRTIWIEVADRLEDRGLRT